MFVISLPLVNCRAGQGVLVKLSLCLFYSSYGLVCLCCERAILLILRYFSKKIVSYGVSVEEVSSGSLYVTILNPLLFHTVLIIVALY